MENFTDKMEQSIREAEKDTVGWIQFMPPEGIAAAEKGTFRLKAIETWRPSYPPMPTFHDECSFEKYFSDHEMPDDYKSDILEGRCVKKSFPKNTEFASCYTIIHNRDIAKSTGRLTKKKQDDLLKYGTGHQDFIYIKGERLKCFAEKIYNSYVPIHDSLCNNGIVTSPIYVRPVCYLSPFDYYSFGMKAEKDSDIGRGLPIIKDEQDAGAKEYFNAGLFGIFAKLDHFKNQNEARMGVTSNKPMGEKWIDISAPGAKPFFDIGKGSDINTISFS